MATTMLSPALTGKTKSLKVDRDVPLANDTWQGQLYTIDDLLACRASTSPDTPVLGYPLSARGRADYVYYSNSNLNRLADEAARRLLSLGLAKTYVSSCPLPGMMLDLASTHVPDFRHRGKYGGD